MYARELGGAGVDPLVDRPQLRLCPAPRGRRLRSSRSSAPRRRSERPSSLASRSNSGESLPAAATLPSSATTSASSRRNQGSMRAQLVELLDRRSRRGARPRGTRCGRRSGRARACRRAGLRGLVESGPACAGRSGSRPGPVVLERAQRLPQRLAEGAPDGHRLAHALHLRGQGLVRPSGTSRRRSAGSSPPRSRAPARTRPASRG